MGANNENHIIYPTYQSILINTIGTVIERMNSDDPFGAWLAIRNLYRWIPEDCQKDVKTQFETICANINKITEKNTQMDAYMTASNRNRKQKEYLRQANETFCDAIRASLGKHNWLDRDATIKPRNEDVPTI